MNLERNMKDNIVYIKLLHVLIKDVIKKCVEMKLKNILLFVIMQKLFVNIVQKII